jgi:ABC transport system ATP-binding/permease protein
MGEHDGQHEAGTEKKDRFFDRYQAAVLSDRYMDIIRADWKNTGLLLLQAPVLAFMAVMVWQNVDKTTPTLYFVMVLSMFWIGCMNACREIVKERALFLRERMFNLDVGSYLYSKVRVLTLVGIVQVGLYAVIVAKHIDTRVPIGWLLLALLATVLCGTCLGLLISATVKRSDYAVGLVPLVIIPQIVFSEFTIPEDQYQGLSQWIFRLMPSRWGYESLMEFAQTAPQALVGAGYMLVMVVYSLVFLLIAYPILKWQKY